MAELRPELSILLRFTFRRDVVLVLDIHLGYFCAGERLLPSLHHFGLDYVTGHHGVFRGRLSRPQEYGELNRGIRVLDDAFRLLFLHVGQCLYNFFHQQIVIAVRFIDFVEL